MAAPVSRTSGLVCGTGTKPQFPPSQRIATPCSPALNWVPTARPELAVAESTALRSYELTAGWAGMMVQLPVTAQAGEPTTTAAAAAAQTNKVRRSLMPPYCPDAVPDPSPSDPARQCR